MNSKEYNQICATIYRISQFFFSEDMEKALVVLLYNSAELMSFARNILELILTFLIKELFSGLGFFTEDLGIQFDSCLNMFWGILALIIE